MEDRNLQIKKEVYNRLYDRVQSIGNKSWHKWVKKNIQADIIKTILGYLPMAASKMLKEWKVAITLVSQEYKSTEGG